ncbi:signal recognition particle-docking protein FtsY [Amycolatopsis rubida]|uniref:Signal recognition particle receptor FtsY n=1 Tax=Amycolatopsis rubida TaxID=112413 RepID=A0ABX0BYJ5_9PSEU|nr:signal recognition particle-docking protein FtsY [Amycolatopsis sp. M39]MYW95690.1 signal recognition particle-docking protein FtsY [Amycolatopsis rubida]NEC60679.1 signal recognition particle-docking protein FtsY [Amycolatopsis rubida]OAP22373.1 Signal recognition particle receptor FtsY [Amycolatopsis sp. M39]
MSSTWFWIVVVAVVVLVAMLVSGLLIARKRRISIAEQREAEAKPKGGGYAASGGISLAPGGKTAEAPPAPSPEPEASPEPVVEHPVEDRPEVDGQPAVGDDAAVPRDSDQRSVRDVKLPEPVAEEEAPEAVVPGTVEPIEEIESPAGRLERLRGRLSKSRSVFGQSLLGLLGGGDLDEDSWQDVEDTLLLADLGAATTTEIVDRLRDELNRRAVRTSGEARELLHEVLTAALSTDAERSVRALPHEVDGEKQPAVVLVAGVNGTGKTTTTGKLARVLVAQGGTVVLGAADTFRAAAADQLQTWGERVGASVVRGKEGADPAAVAFDAVKQGISEGVDTVLVDTAGRLHTKTGLMDELGKVKRVVEKQARVDEVLLVLDATTGQNGLAQARVFAEVIDVTGIVLTKLDGTAKGGIVFQVQKELGVPVKLVGLGEGPDDLAPFEPGAFVDALLG